MNPNNALITGATSGIGLEFARLCAGRGDNVVLVARDEVALRKVASELEAQYKIKAWIFAKDLSEPNQVEELVRAIEQEKITISTLINNAGFGDFGLFTETDWKKEEQMLQLNIAALTRLTKVYAQKMKAAGNGKILNLASMAAFMPGPLMAVYYATKAYVLSLSEALANELAGSGVTVTALCPGPTQSNFQKAANLDKSALFQNKKLPTAADVAVIGYRGMLAGKAVVIPGLGNKLSIFFLRFVPRSLMVKIVREFQKKL